MKSQKLPGRSVGQGLSPSDLSSFCSRKKKKKKNIQTHQQELLAGTCDWIMAPVPQKIFTKGYQTELWSTSLYRLKLYRDCFFKKKIDGDRIFYNHCRSLVSVSHFCRSKCNKIFPSSSGQIAGEDRS